MSVSSWVVTWTGPTPASARLETGQQQGQVDVFLNTNTSGIPDHSFTTPTGQDLILLGSLTNFTVVDKLQAKEHPGADVQGDKGIKVQGGTNSTLKIDATGHTNDTLFQVKDSSHVDITDRHLLDPAVTGFSYFDRATIAHLVIKTNDVNVTDGDFLTDFRAPNMPGNIADTSHANWLPNEGTNVIVAGLTAGTDVVIDTGGGTHDKLQVGLNNTITGPVTVLTGAGDDIVSLEDPDPNAGGQDDRADVLTDFVYGGQPGLGNELYVHSAGIARIDNAPGTGGHTDFVDTVRVVGMDSNDVGQLFVQHAATIGSLELLDWATATMQASGTTVTTLMVHETGGRLVATAPAELGLVTLLGDAFFGAGSAGSTIQTLDMNSFSATLDLDGNANLSVDTLTNENTGTINAPNTSTLTIQDATDSDTLDFNLANQGSADVHVVGTFTVTGVVNVNDGILLTVGSFSAADGRVNVNAHASMTVQDPSVVRDLNVVGAGASALFLSTNAHVTNLTITTGGLVTLQTTPSGDPRVLVVNNLTIGSGADSGKLDLANNAMIIDYGSGSPIDSVRSLIARGYHSGPWDGDGITSSSAAAHAGDANKTALGFAEATALFPNSTFPVTYLGQSVDDTAVIVRYTWFGDCNIDGNVDLTDFTFMAANFNVMSGATWIMGDMNYDGMVDLTDFTFLAANFNQTGFPPP